MTIGSEIIFCENLSSTNTHALALLKSQCLKEGTIISAGYQTSGRGQSTNKWESQANMNLLISIILYPEKISPIDQFVISKTISLGICDFLKRYTSGVSIKWPNDIYVNDDKIAGILIESSILCDKIENLIAGIGLNINQRSYGSSIPNPVSLRMITGNEYDLGEVLTGLASNLNIRYQSLLSGKRAEIDTEYLNNLYRFNIFSEFRDSSGVFTGRISSVSCDGHLVIEDEKGRIRVYGYKEVTFL